MSRRESCCICAHKKRGEKQEVRSKKKMMPSEKEFNLYKFLNTDLVMEARFVFYLLSSFLLLVSSFLTISNTGVLR